MLLPPPLLLPYLSLLPLLPSSLCILFTAHSPNEKDQKRARKFNHLKEVFYCNSRGQHTRVSLAGSKSGLNSLLL
jgi:hypothetical protein